MMLWHRQAELVLSGKLYHSDDIDLEFSVPFSTENEPDLSEIIVYNLSPGSVSMIKKGIPVSLSAGYAGDVGMLCSGVVSSFSTVMDGVDRKTTLKIGTAAQAWQEKKIHKTYAKDTTAKMILEDLIQQFGVSIADMTVVKDVTYSKGKTVSGRLKDVVKKLAKETESKFYLDKDRAYVRPFDKGTGSGFVLSPSTGLLGSPEPAELSEGNQKSKQGWKIRCLLNHNIGVDSLISVQSKEVSGMYRVVKGRHTSEWMTEMEVI